MQITLGDTVLIAGQTRSTGGSPVGPGQLQMSERPGVVHGSYIGADRTEPEHIAPDFGSISFTATRIFDTLEDALEYVTSDIYDEAVEGQLKFGDRPVFGERSAVTSRNVSMVGVTVIIQYTIEG